MLILRSHAAAHADVAGNERIMAAIDKMIKAYNFCK